MKCIKKQLSLYKDTLHNGSNENCLLAYKNYRNTLTRLKQNCKIMYYQNQCEQFKRNTKKLWELINKTTGKVNDKSCIVKFIKNGDIYHYSSKSICNEFTSYFLSMGNEFYQKIPNLEKITPITTTVFLLIHKIFS